MPAVISVSIRCLSGPLRANHKLAPVLPSWEQSMLFFPSNNTGSHFLWMLGWLQYSDGNWSVGKPNKRQNKKTLLSTLIIHKWVAETQDFQQLTWCSAFKRLQWVQFPLPHNSTYSSIDGTEDEKGGVSKLSNQNWLVLSNFSRMLRLYCLCYTCHGVVLVLAK